MNLDKPFKLIPCGSKEDPKSIYTTEDERWLVFRRPDGWIVSDTTGRTPPRPVTFLSGAIWEIKERLTGTEWHRHKPLPYV